MDYIAVIDKLEKELAEQCLLNAMGQEREAKLLARLGKMTDWKPIETAPKGKRVIVYYTNSNGKDRIVFAVYVEKYTSECYEDWAEYDEETDMYYSPQGWYELCDNWDEYSSFSFAPDHIPTHWMPLPEPPTK